MPHPVRVLVRTSDPITQAGLAAQLGGCPDIEIVTEPSAVPAVPAASWRVPELAGAAAASPGRPLADRRTATATAGAIAGWRPERTPPTDRAEGAPAVDVALVSAEAVDEDTLRTVREIQQGGVPVVLVVADLDGHDLTAAVDAGAVGLLRRASATPETVLTAVRGAAAGDGYLPPDLLGPLLRQVRQVSTQVLAPRGLTFSGLSERELAVLRLVSEGLDTREIGRRLCYSERTVKNVLQDVTRRFGLRNRSHAVAYAFRHGLL
ncbi:helix-turn-helix transcriptional regulator [Parafrankia soli]|uniref:Helix-turn-helix transcriptional regulator n=1 Tax=Parafrankia soli TaxID=2599596 RepID=A0A1S1PXR0_9ACTN|nr:response regulator transcription factor [Parafrankia soli]OHV25725.1 helix-turn-helix transcriptional regulator [Parafrankia soli]